MARADPDGELLRRVAERDPRAFEQLYRRYARPVYGLALRLVGEPEEAEEATRRAFAALRHSASTFRPADADGARWIFRVAAQAIAGGEQPEEDWAAFRVHAALGRLPERERASLELAYWGDPRATDTTAARTALLRLATALEGGS